MILTLSTFYRRQKNFLYLPDSDRQNCITSDMAERSVMERYYGHSLEGRVCDEFLKNAVDISKHKVYI